MRKIDYITGRKSGLKQKLQPFFYWGDVNEANILVCIAGLIIRRDYCRAGELFLHSASNRNFDKKRSVLFLRNKYLFAL